MARNKRQSKTQLLAESKGFCCVFAFIHSVDGLNSIEAGKRLGMGASTVRYYRLAIENGRRKCLIDWRVARTALSAPCRKELDDYQPAAPSRTSFGRFLSASGS